MARVVVAVLSTIVLTGCSVFGVRSGYEQLPYEVVARLDPVTEIRRYAPHVAAEANIEAADCERGENEAFRLLFDYISGANRAGAQIAMTAPVETTGGTKIAMTVPVETVRAGDGRVRMRFFLPAAFTAETAPAPLDDRVRVVTVPERKMAFTRFTGLAGDDAVSERTDELLRKLQGSAWRPVSTPVALFYDPPWTIPFLRRNEVGVAVVPAPTTN